MSNGQRVVCAANLYRDGRIVLGVRHYDELMVGNIVAKGIDEPEVAQGFVDQFGKFLTREQAWQVASEAGQIIRRCGGDGAKLYSENLY